MATSQVSYYTGDDDISTFTYQTQQAQTFTTVDAFDVTRADVKLYRISGTAGTVTVAIHATTSGLPSGSALSTGTVTRAAITSSSSGATYTIAMSAASLGSTTQYALVLSSDTSDATAWFCDATSPAYSGGSRCYSSNYGASWTADTGKDFMFDIWGDASAYTDLVGTITGSGSITGTMTVIVGLTGTITGTGSVTGTLTTIGGIPASRYVIKRLIAFGTDGVYYEVLS